jgi:hypothetical protein
MAVFSLCMDNQFQSSTPQLTKIDIRRRQVLIGGVSIFILCIILAFIWYRQQQIMQNVSTYSSVKSEMVVQQVMMNTSTYTAAIDADLDGIPNSEEATLGTSNRDFDSDHDGISDWDEIHTWKTNPMVIDSDGDGFSDGIEIIRGYNPLGKGTLN